jgi:hypothetical protein
MPRTLAQKAAKAEHLRLAAKLSLARAVRTEEPEVVERLVVRAGEYLDQQHPFGHENRRTQVAAEKWVLPCGET